MGHMKQCAKIETVFLDMKCMCRSVMGKREQAADVNIICQPSKSQKASKASWSSSEAQGSSFTQAVTHINSVLSARQTCPAFGAYIDRDVLVSELCKPHQKETPGCCCRLALQLWKVLDCWCEC